MRNGRSRKFGSFGPNFSGLRLGPGLPLTPAMKALLIANFAVFVLSRLPGVDTLNFELTFGLIPSQVFAHGKLWQLITYSFLHGGLIHIGVNMFMLWTFGTVVAHRWGDRDFLIYYFVCVLGGALASWLSHPHGMAPTIGASAGVIGVLLGFAMMYPDSEVMLPILIRMRMKTFMLCVVGLEAFLAVVPLETGVAHFAHLGGVAAGWIYLKQDWRLSAFSRKLKAQRARVKMTQNSHREQRRQAHSAEVDRILEKISSEGIESLTEAERNVLRDASRH
jgi:membrane associated rhomboid family serine protease